MVRHILETLNYNKQDTLGWSHTPRPEAPKHID